MVRIVHWRIRQQMLSMDQTSERLSDYAYDLPEGLIAQDPLEDRASARMLHLCRATGQVEHRQFRDLVKLLSPDDLLVFNDTRVSAVRLLGKKPSGAAVEALVLRPSTIAGHYVGLVRPGKRLRVGAEIVFPEGLRATVVGEQGGGERVLRFSCDGSIVERLNAVGRVPLPPYIHQHLSNPERYQTVYSRSPGSAAAPTAGLHFDLELLDQLRERRVQMASVTLDVGIDTFRPVEAENLDEHVMHGEICRVPRETADAVNLCSGRVIAVGTTATRTLESFAVGKGQIEPGEKSTELFIRPGYEFNVISGMLTNFHLPRTTMLMMISALSSRAAIFAAYDAAIRERYRFLSFGDSMLII